MIIHIEDSACGAVRGEIDATSVGKLEIFLFSTFWWITAVRSMD